MRKKTFIILIAFAFLTLSLSVFADTSDDNVTSVSATSTKDISGTDFSFSSKKNESEFRSNFIQSISILSILVGLMIASIFLFKRIKSKNGNFSGNLRIASNCYIGNNKRISILEADSRRFLIGVTSSQINILSELSPQDKMEDLENSATGKQNKSFKQYFENIVSPSSGKNLISRIITGRDSGKIELKKAD